MTVKMNNSGLISPNRPKYVISIVVDDLNNAQFVINKPVPMTEVVTMMLGLVFEFSKNIHNATAANKIGYVLPDYDEIKVKAMKDVFQAILEPLAQVVEKYYELDEDYENGPKGQVQ
jgi:hypothetical protein